MARKPKFTARISAVINQETRNRLDALERDSEHGMNEIIREVLEAGLPAVEAKRGRATAG